MFYLLNVFTETVESSGWNSVAPWLVPVLTLVTTTVITTVTGLVVSRKVNDHFRKKDEEDARTRRALEEAAELRDKNIREQRIEDVQNAVEKGLIPVQEKIDVLSDKLDNNTDGTLTLLRDRMKWKKDQLVKQGSASSADIAN